MKINEAEWKGSDMLTKLKFVSLILVCAAVALQLTGCMYERRDNLSDRDHGWQNDRDRQHSDRDPRVH